MWDVGLAKVNSPPPRTGITGVSTDNSLHMCIGKLFGFFSMEKKEPPRKKSKCAKKYVSNAKIY